MERYHEWMKSEELLETTASEPLTLEKEYEMQQSWRNDDDKCTFILVDKQNLVNDVANISSVEQQGISLEQSVKHMCGDVNAFLSKLDDPDDPDCGLTSAEMEIMIAEKSSRRKGIAQEAVQLLMEYIYENLNVRRFVAKIGESNEGSLLLFQNKLHFQIHKHVKVFEEIHLKYPVDRQLPVIKYKMIQMDH